MGTFLLGVAAAYAHTGVVLPWDTSEFDYATAPPDAWKVLDLHVSVTLGILAFCWAYYQAMNSELNPPSTGPVEA